METQKLLLPAGTTGLPMKSSVKLKEEVHKGGFFPLPNNAPTFQPTRRTSARTISFSTAIKTQLTGNAKHSINKSCRKPHQARQDVSIQPPRCQVGK
ncbi:hypothetical protein BaRGS_00028989 [Batillaria attramentaria]|uniref:Uncharacterized protein n=1 Tax=Batillaria attramentaria TaxID=370345 RepID=A0ABD0JXL5_9CAEN